MGGFKGCSRWPETRGAPQAWELALDPSGVGQPVALCTRTDHVVFRTCSRHFTPLTLTKHSAPRVLSWPWVAWVGDVSQVELPHCKADVQVVIGALDRIVCELVAPENTPSAVVPVMTACGPEGDDGASNTLQVGGRGEAGLVWRKEAGQLCGGGRGLRTCGLTSEEGRRERLFWLEKRSLVDETNHSEGWNTGFTHSAIRRSTPRKSEPAFRVAAMGPPDRFKSK